VENLVNLAIENWGDGSYLIENSAATNPHEAHLLKLDISKARMYLGWQPVYNINETVARTIRWYKTFYSGATRQKALSLSEQEIQDYTKFMSIIHEKRSKLT
jgi:CDP-glucose 4,6-dehydratase